MVHHFKRGAETEHGPWQSRTLPAPLGTFSLHIHSSSWEHQKPKYLNLRIFVSFKPRTTE